MTKAELTKRIDDAINLAIRYGQTDVSDHRLWVIDQMVRILAGDGYEEIIAYACDGCGDWKVGTPP
mgnify:FL=1